MVAGASGRPTSEGSHYLMTRKAACPQWRGSGCAKVGEYGADAPVVGGGGGETELADDVADVGLDRVRCDQEPFRDAAIGQPLGHERQDLAFSGCGLIEWAALPGVADQLGDKARIDDDLARGDAFESGDEVVDVEYPVLQQVAHPPAVALEKPEGVLGLDIARAATRRR